VREFVTSVEDAFDPEPDSGLEMKLDGEVLRYFKPTDGQVAIYMASSGRHASANDRTAALVDFFLGLFDENSQDILAKRLRDRDDPFGVKKIGEIIESMLEDWSGRPIQSSSASTPSRRSAGRKSTPRTPASTSSDSPSIAS